MIRQLKLNTLLSTKISNIYLLAKDSQNQDKALFLVQKKAIVRCMKDGISLGPKDVPITWAY